jgi:hypothetical protein
MKFNFTLEGKLTVNQIKKINELEPIVREEYDYFIGDLTSANECEGMDWFLEVTCRNTFASNLHQRMCKLALLEDMINEGESIEEVIVDCPSMKKAVTSLLNKENTNCKVITSRKIRFRLLTTLYKISASLYLMFNQWAWSKVVKRKRTPGNEIVLLENFLFLDSFDENYKFLDRNYPGFFDYYDKKDLRKVWYLPILNGIKHPHHWISLFQKINKSEEQIIIKEDYLLIRDYFSAFISSFLVPLKLKKCPNWRGIDISSLVFDEAKDELGSYSLVSSILCYKFFFRFKDQGFKPQLLIDWHENQTIDRALNLGMKQSFPSVKTKGYQGFVVSEYYSSLTPTLYEKQNGLIPDEIFVISKPLIQKRLKYSKDLKVSLAPAFRYTSAINYKKQKTDNKKIVLVALPMLHSESRQVLDLVLNANFDSEVEIVVKRHPTVLESELIKNVTQSRDKRIRFTKDKLTDLFDKTSLFITMTSSAAIESILCQTFVAIVANNSGATANPIENIVDPKYWRLCYTPNCIGLAFEQSKKNSVMDKTNYLVPLNNDTFEKFIN